MKTIKIVMILSAIACFMSACDSKAKTAPATITINGERTCYLPYELNPLDINDTINRMFYDGTKIGRWIIFEWSVSKGKQLLETATIPVRIKKEEGYYDSNNKKTGYWKFYRKDGTFRDSVRYQNGVADC